MVGQNLGIVFEEANGVILRDTHGKEYLDGASQLSCVNLGYGDKRIIDATMEQMNKLQYTTIHYGFTHPAVIECSRKLAEITPEGLDHFLFTCGGSESTESAFKISRWYWRNMGRDKYKIISLYNSYHGVSLGSISATGAGKGSFVKGILPVAPGFIHIPSYYCYRCAFGKEYPDCNIECAHFLARTIESEGPENVAAFIAEPSQGAGGAIAPPPEYWPIVRKICSDSEVLLISDEIITGFGRTGTFWGLDNWRVKPDVMSLGKGITSAYLPFGAVAINHEVYEGLKGVRVSAFTYSGHPVCCATATKAMEIYIKEKVAENAVKVGKHVLKRLKDEFLRLPCVGEVGGLGLMLGMEIVKDKTSKATFDLSENVMAKIQKQALENGLFIRVINIAMYPGDRVCFTPPLTITIEEADRALDILYPLIANLNPR
jgi:adenosylmethionine-8-amino-7-oxononanoate aminotransferase